MTRPHAAAFLLLMASGMGSLGHAQGYQPSFRPDALSDHPAGSPNQVLVLGTPHLSGLPTSFRPEMVEPLLQRLLAWHPTAVASEDISGLQCDAMRRQRERQAEAVATYCFDPAAAGQAAGMDVPAANAQAERMLTSWPARPSPAQRRRLALVFLAAGEPASALVQWLRLPPAERRADGRLTADLANHLQGLMTRRNETDLIAVQLAARSGLERVWGVDDQSFVGAPVDEKAYAAAVEHAWDNPATKARAATDAALYARLAQPGGLLDLYRAFNAPGFATQKYQSDWGAALTEPSASAYGRRYVGYWETRNLRMVANLRELLGRSPGSRLVAIVGASHKGYYEGYLHQMRDVTLADVETVLQ